MPITHPNFVLVNHPLIGHKLTLMRQIETPCNTFRILLKEISFLISFEMTRDLPLGTKTITTPMGQMKDAPVIAGKKVCVVPILRAGLGMGEGIMELIPSAREGHIGLYRDPTTHEPVEYLVKLPDVSGRTFLVCDPMLATGHSLSYAIDVLNKRGVVDDDIRVMVLVASPEGVDHLSKTHPKVRIWCAALDSHLDSNKYIIPGLGDAGDRLFGTK